MHAIVLKYLEEVARRGSIRKASRTLNVASSAINRQILKLEQSRTVSIPRANRFSTMKSSSSNASWEAA